MKETYREPVYTIGTAARLLGVCPATLRIWERKGLLRPKRISKSRFYSKCDMDRLEYIKEMIQKKGINIEGVKAVLKVQKCWELKKCKIEERRACPVYLQYGNA